MPQWLLAQDASPKQPSVNNTNSRHVVLIIKYQLLAGTTDTGHTKACEATRSGLVQPGSRRRCATHKDVGGDANVNTNLGSNGVLANFQLAAGQLEVHASGECQRALQHLEKDVINEERQATPLISEPTPGVPIRVFCRLIYSVTTIRAH
ncbi:hypothetical protein PC115_g22994 [Phytophthora cactorum]|uniref:Uncharacterized protein n=1 Tax=Phytophthora cactorum TaxID=29920 RepID=A0A8T1AGB6_9STRA|nr:hypothetical protein PC115_g22994 [Phytophthora cactorum]